ncbi:hypothetical protein E3P98_03992 [Wallemia ichthyophaga]|nr:hypothetical protein E3P98_03992 [Wallemia ichthyophaga]
MDGNHRKSADLLEGRQSPPSESSSAAFYGKYLLTDKSFDFSAQDPRENLSELRASTDAYISRSPTPAVKEQISKAMEQALEKFKVEARDTLRECLHEQQHNLAKYLKETTLALEQQIQELKEQNVEPQIMPAAPSKQLQKPQRYRQKKAITLTLHQADPAKPVLSDNYIKPADTKRIMDEHIAKTFDDRLDDDDDDEI